MIQGTKLLPIVGGFGVTLIILAVAYMVILLVRDLAFDIRPKPWEEFTLMYLSLVGGGILLAIGVGVSVRLVWEWVARVI